MLPNYRRGCSVRQEALSGAYRGGTGALWMPLSAANPSSTPLLVCMCVCVLERVRKDEEERGESPELGSKTCTVESVACHHRKRI